MSSDNPKRHFTLTNAALSGLRTILASSEWFKGDTDALKHSFRAGDLLENIIPELVPFKAEVVFNPRGEKELKDGENERAMAWEKDMAPEFCVSERQYDSIKKCLEWATKNGVLPNGRHKNMLIKQAGLAPSDE